MWSGFSGGYVDTGGYPMWHGDEVIMGGKKGGMGSCGMVWGPWCSQKGLRR